MEDIRLSDSFGKHDNSILRLVLKEILFRIATVSDCQSSSIRLQENGDFPFVVHKGTPDFFVLKENSLLVKDDYDQVMYDQNGSQLLDCMCGNVIRGHITPRFPFFSKKGSFWTNSTTHLLNSITDKQRKFIGSTRNLCNYSGYESVALIPLKSEGNIIGLVHLADPREDMFTIEKIEKLELIAEESAAMIKSAEEIGERLLKIDGMSPISENSSS